MGRLTAIVKPSEVTTRLAAVGAANERDDRLGLLVGIGSLAMVVGADVVLGADVTLAGTYVVAPFLAAIWAGVPATSGVAVLTLIAAGVSGEWNENLWSTDYNARLLLVVVCGLLAVASAWARERARAGTRRVELLSSVGAVADGSLPLGETLSRVLEVIVPAFADFCMVDAIHDRRVIRSAVRAGGTPRAREIERYLAARDPSLPEWMTRPDAPFPRHPRFIPNFTDEDLRRLSHGQSDLEWMRSLGLTSSITVSMIARKRVLGALTLCTAWSGRHYSQLDVRFAKALAGRVALALDNAGLFSDLESVERRMDNVMSILDEAVVIHDSQDELVFANPAARRIFGLGQEDGATPVSAAIQGRFHVRDEEGRPVPAEELVGRPALTLGEAGTRVLRVTSRETGEERWYITRAKPIMGTDGPLYSVTAIEDVTDVKRAEFDQRVLAEAGDLLARTSDPQRMLRGIADLAVPEFADWCSVEGPDTPAAEMVRSGEPLLIEPPDPVLESLARNAEDLVRLRGLGIASLMLAPMTAGGRVTGVVAYANGETSRRFDDHDLDVAAEIGRRVGVAAENARLASERADVARVLQHGLMPSALPQMPGWETAAVYQPAGEVNEVGGDFYDAFQIEGGWMIVMGDVVGRGAAAASLTALARHTIRTAGVLSGDPCRALSMLDSALRERGPSALCTAAILILPDSDEDPVDVSLVSAGHPLPLLLRDGAVTEVGRPGPLLGAFEDSSWKPVAHALRTDDQLVLFTDGVIEARGARDRFGEDRLRSELAGADRPLTAVGRVTGALEHFIGGEPEDDVAMVVIRRAARRPAAAEPRRATVAA